MSRGDFLVKNHINHVIKVRIGIGLNNCTILFLVGVIKIMSVATIILTFILAFVITLLVALYNTSISCVDTFIRFFFNIVIAFGVFFI